MSVFKNYSTLFIIYDVVSDPLFVEFMAILIKLHLWVPDKTVIYHFCCDGYFLGGCIFIYTNYLNTANLSIQF